MCVCVCVCVCVHFPPLLNFPLITILCLPSFE